MTKISLAYLNNKDLLKEIAEYDPVLIYYICYLGNREKFESHIFNEETDCRELAKKWDLTKYRSPGDRPFHPVNCILKHKSIYEEFVDRGICKEMLEFFKQRDDNGNHISIDREKFRELFREKFTFKEDPEDLINNKLNEIREKYYISLPPNNNKIKNKGNLMTISYNIEEDIFLILVEMICKCSNIISNNFSETDITISYSPHNIECGNCGNFFIIAHNFYRFDLISPQ